jgi:hypothetical protein
LLYGLEQGTLGERRLLVASTCLRERRDRLAMRKVARMTPDLNQFRDYQNEIYLNGLSS